MNTMKKVLVFGSTLLAATVLLAGCGGGGGSGGGSGSSSSGGACGESCGPNQQSSSFNLSLVDDPVSGGYQHVVIDISQIELTGPAGTAKMPSQAQALDLLNLQGSLQAAMMVPSHYGITAGTYTSLVLDITSGAGSDYVVTSDGGQYPLTVPATITIPANITIPSGGEASDELYLDLRRDLVVTAGAGGVSSYALQVSPQSLILMDQQTASFVNGTVSPTLTIGGQPIAAQPMMMPDGSMSGGCDPEVYLYAGSVTKLDGYSVQVSGGGAQPYESSAIDVQDGTPYQYSFPAVPAGTYTVAVTCAIADKTGATSLAFSSPKTVTVAANQDQQVNF